MLMMGRRHFPSGWVLLPHFLWCRRRGTMALTHWPGLVSLSFTVAMFLLSHDLCSCLAALTGDHHSSSGKWLPSMLLLLKKVQQLQLLAIVSPASSLLLQTSSHLPMSLGNGRPFLWISTSLHSLCYWQTLAPYVGILAPKSLKSQPWVEEPLLNPQFSSLSSALHLVVVECLYLHLLNLDFLEYSLTFLVVNAFIS